MKRIKVIAKSRTDASRRIRKAAVKKNMKGVFMFSQRIPFDDGTGEYRYTYYPDIETNNKSGIEVC